MYNKKGELSARNKVSCPHDGNVPCWNFLAPTCTNIPHDQWTADAMDHYYDPFFAGNTPMSHHPSTAIDHVVGNNYHLFISKYYARHNWLQVDFGSESTIVTRIDVVKRLQDPFLGRFKVILRWK